MARNVSASHSKTDDIDHPVGYLLRRAYYVAKANTGALLKALNITPTQASAVMALAREGSLSQAQLGRAIGMEPGNVHSLLSRLKGLGYIKLVADADDQRQVRVVLSKAGERNAAQLAALTKQSSGQTLSVLTVKEQELFVALLKRVAMTEPTD